MAAEREWECHLFIWTWFVSYSLIYITGGLGCKVFHELNDLSDLDKEVQIGKSIKYLESTISATNLLRTPVLSVICQRSTSHTDQMCNFTHILEVVIDVLVQFTTALTKWSLEQIYSWKGWHEIASCRMEHFEKYFPATVNKFTMRSTRQWNFFWATNISQLVAAWSLKAIPQYDASWNRRKCQKAYRYQLAASEYWF